MLKLLLIENSGFFHSVIVKALEAEVETEIIYVSSFAEAAKKINEHGIENFFVALLDFQLPNVHNGDIIDYIQNLNIPVIIFTESYSEDLHDCIFLRNVVDYVIKENSAGLTYLVSLVKRLYRNRTTTVLVVDDSEVTRADTADLLRSYQLKVIEAKNGLEAIKILKHNPDVVLLVTDYSISHIDGFELISQVRRTHDRDTMAIIGVSTGGGALLASKFIKVGANDFISRPFLCEEFFCRVSMNLDLLDRFQTLRDAAIKDFLTGIYNRRFLYDFGSKLAASARRSKVSMTAAMIDIDYFKKINDTYGHDVGDEILSGVASILKGYMRREADILARVGGEEFCILLQELAIGFAAWMFESIRAEIQQTMFDTSAGSLGVTISLGVHHGMGETLGQLLVHADANLYTAKNSGRNRVITSGEPPRLKINHG